MVLDFTDIKRVVAAWIDDNLDHRMILQRNDPAVPALKKLERAAVSDRRQSHGGKHCPLDLRLHGRPWFSGRRRAIVGNAPLLCHLPSIEDLTSSSG